MTDWLVDVLDVLDVQPRAAGASLHLLLDLYQRQSRKLELFLSKDAASELISQQARQEAQAAQAALLAGGHAQALENLQAQLKASDTSNWPQTRRIVLQALNTLDGTTGQATRENETAIVREMVQQSSRQLAALGALG